MHQIASTGTSLTEWAFKRWNKRISTVDPHQMHPQCGGTSSLLPCPDAASNAQLDFDFDSAVLLFTGRAALSQSGKRTLHAAENMPFTQRSPRYFPLPTQIAQRIPCSELANNLPAMKPRVSKSLPTSDRSSLVARASRRCVEIYD